MTNSAANIQTNSKALGTYPVDYSSKALASPSTKNLGADPTLADWYERAYAYYNEVTNGGTPPPSEAEWFQFLDYMKYAASELGLSNQFGEGVFAQAGQPGAGVGAMNNMVYDSEEATINATGQGTVHDSHAYQNTLNVPSTAGEVTYSITTDTRLQPATEVLKAVIKNKLTGTEEVVFFHNFRDPEFSLNINTVQGKHVSGDAAGINIEVGEYDPEAASGEGTSGTGQILNGPAPSKNDAGEWEVEAASMDEADTIDMKPTGSGVEGEEEIWRVWGHLTVSVAPSDTVQVLDGADAAGDGGYWIVVTPKEGSKDVIIAMPGTRNITINADPLNVKWGDPGVSAADGLIPEEFSDAITLNGGVTDVAEMDSEEAKVINELTEATGKSVDEIIAAMNEAGLETADGKKYETPEDLLKAVKDGHFPPKAEDINYQFLKFFSLVDSEYAEAVGEVFEAIQNGDHDAKRQAQEKMTERLVELLNTVYPDDVDIQMHEQYPALIVIDGIEFGPSYSEDGLGDKIYRSNYPNEGEMWTDSGSGWEKDN